MAARLLLRRAAGGHLSPSSPPFPLPLSLAGGLCSPVRRMGTASTRICTVTEDGRYGNVFLGCTITLCLLPAVDMVWRRFQIEKRTAEVKATIERLDQEIKQLKEEKARSHQIQLP